MTERQLKAKQIRMICIHDEITVVPVAEAKRTIGKGEHPVTWKHSALFDTGGNPYCGKALSDDDVAQAAD